MSSVKIAILDDYQNVALSFADWSSLNAQIEVHTDFYDTPESLTHALTGAEVVVAMRERTKFSAETLARLPSLRLLVSTGPRNAAIDLAAAHALGITVTSTRYIPYPPAEHTWALILAAARNIAAEAQAVKEGKWQIGVAEGLHGHTLGLLGLGSIGSSVARVGQAFGMETISWSQNLTADHAARHGVRPVSRKELFTQSDILSVHLQLSERTRGLVGPAELAMMKRTAMLVNTSRGPIVDEPALMGALKDGRIRHAALDVFEHEPLPAGHPLRSLGNALVTPHIGYITREQYEVFYCDAVQDIDAFLSGNPIRVME